MVQGLDYFKKMYSDVPNWVQVMHDYNPEMLTRYTEFRAEAFKESVLTAIEKDELISALNAGRLYSRSMMLHSAGAHIKGGKLEDAIEYFLVAGHYNGIEALETSLRAIRQYLKEDGKEIPKCREEYRSISEIIEDLLTWTEGYDQTFLKMVKEGLDNQESYESLVFKDGRIKSSRKYLAYVGMFITELDGPNSIEAFKFARENGVTDAELAELGYIIIFTSGIPSWFEMSDSLEPINK